MSSLAALRADIDGSKILKLPLDEERAMNIDVPRTQRP